MEALTNFTTVALPLIGASLVTALAAGWFVRRVTQNQTVVRAALVIVFVACLVPFGDLSAAEYIRVLTGDLSPVSLVLFSMIAYARLVSAETEDSVIAPSLAAAIVVIALLLFPTAMGLTLFDMYEYGYYPIVLAPLGLALFAGCVWFGIHLPAILIAVAFTGFVLGVLESDNLWDYLIDPVITVYAIGHLVRNRGAGLSIKWPPSQEHVETNCAFLIASFLLFAVFLASNNPDSFRYEFTVEDGFIEWVTVVILLVAMVVCARRVYTLWGKRPPLFLGVTGLLAAFCLFGAGEEISWGQRILGLETPEYFMERNAQGEIGLHNLVVEINGEEVKLNKLIFGTGLAIAMLIYLFIATPLYRTKPLVTNFFHQIAAPMPRNYQVVGYLAIVATVELLVDSSKRGEMTEFAGATMFALNIIYPYNPHIFDPNLELKPGHQDNKSE